MRTVVLTWLLLLSTSLALAQDGVSFANLVIMPFGDELLDISTGISTLPDGGRVIDRASGVELESGWISYLAGEFIETGAATMTGPFGSVTGGAVRIDVPAGLVSVLGDIGFNGTGLQVTGTELTYFVDQGVIRLSGGVQAPQPVFSAAELFYHTASGTVLLLGPYAFDDGFISLSSSQPGEFLELVGAAGGDSGDGDAPARFRVDSEPSPETLAAFRHLIE